MRTALILFSGILIAQAEAATWSGVLVDAKCAAGATPAAAGAIAGASGPDQIGNRASQAVRDKLEGEQWRNCRPGRTTAKFALLLNDGKMVKLDSGGNTRAAAVLKSAQSRKPVHAEVSGAMQADIISVDSIRVSK